ncbi:MAG: DMT family transporter [Solirubrobacteraceae bacterium]
MGIALGLGAALSWGLADYFAALASRQVGALRVVLFMHLAAMIPLTVVVLATDGLAGVSLSQLGVLFGMGAVGWLSYLAFYGALAIGPISVLSPIISGYAAVTVLLAVVISSEQLSGLQAVAVAVTIAGAVCACLDFGAIAQARIEPRSALGFVLAFGALALLGGFVFGVSYYRPHLGWVAPIFLARGFATVFLVTHVLAAPGKRRPHPSPKLFGIIALLACLDTGGYVCFNLGVGYTATAVVAAASAPYALVPIVMGVSLFGERPTLPQWLGVGLVIAGVITLGLAT